MHEYDTVRVVKLLEANRHFDGSGGSVSHAPQVGDLGVIVDVLKADEAFSVECVDEDGYTVWLADFVAEELVPAP